MFQSRYVLFRTIFKSNNIKYFLKDVFHIYIAEYTQMYEFIEQRKKKICK